MEPVKIFSLIKHDGAYESWPLKTELLKENKPTGKFVPGYVLDSQFRYGEKYLLVTSWDCPFEEAQEFLLLSKNLKVISKQHLGAPYSSVWIDGYKIDSENSVLFHCGENLDVLIKIRDKRPYGIGSLLQMQLIYKKT